MSPAPTSTTDQISRPPLTPPPRTPPSGTPPSFGTPLPPVAPSRSDGTAGSSRPTPTPASSHSHAPAAAVASRPSSSPTVADPEPTSETTPLAGGGRRPPLAVVVAGTFVLGGLVGAAGFGLGQQYASSETETSEPVVRVAAPRADTTIPDATVPIPDTGASPLDVEPAAAVARMLGPSVVQVETDLGQGSGVVYDDGLLLTNHHVIQGASQVRIRTAAGRVVDVEVLGSDPRNDIAVLAAADSALPAAAIGSSAELEVGQLTVAIGSPFQLQQTVTAGIVSSINRPVPNLAGGISAMIQTDAPINPGNSGGALANRNGELVGINTSIRTDGTSNSNVGIGFAVPIDTAIEVADRIVAGDSLEPGVLGVTGDGQDGNVGVLIAEVVPGSGAAAAGVQPGDRVLTVDEAPVTNIGELVGLIQSHFSGDTVELEIQRGDMTLTVEATLS